MSDTCKVFDSLHLQWMWIWMHPYNITAALIDQTLGRLLQQSQEPPTCFMDSHLNLMHPPPMYPVAPAITAVFPACMSSENAAACCRLSKLISMTSAETFVDKISRRIARISWDEWLWGDTHTVVVECKRKPIAFFHMHDTKYNGSDDFNLEPRIMTVWYDFLCMIHMYACVQFIHTYLRPGMSPYHFWVPDTYHKTEYYVYVCIYMYRYVCYAYSFVVDNCVKRYVSFPVEFFESSLLRHADK